MTDSAPEASSTAFAVSGPIRVLALDGGGAKGFYTLGVLRQIEAQAKKPLCEHFGLIYGTSTGAIIAALLALGHSVDAIHQFYKDYVPTVMRTADGEAKSAALHELAKAVFKDADFTHVRTALAIVTTRWDFQKPMIFKSTALLAHGRKGTFKAGFGCTIADAVEASCSAYPFFSRKIVTTANGDVELVDGGFCANNPTLYAIADAVMALHMKPEDIRVVSIGVGKYPPAQRPTPLTAMLTFDGLIKTVGAQIPQVVMLRELVSKMFEINTQSMEQLRSVLFDSIPTIRISQPFEQPEMATDLMEHDLGKLNQLYQRGWESFGEFEKRLEAF